MIAGVAREPKDYGRVGRKSEMGNSTPGIVAQRNPSESDIKRIRSRTAGRSSNAVIVAKDSRPNSVLQAGKHNRRNDWL
jgi:hypothetical protein